MSDIKSVIVLLCKHLNLSTKLPFKPEYFRLAKFNETNVNVAEILWAALHILVYHAVKDKQTCISFFRYDRLMTIKLCLAYLNYQMVEFYALTPHDNCSRQLLLAFAWLIGTKDVLNILVKSRLIVTHLGREFSFSQIDNKSISQIDPTLSCNVLMNSILCVSSKLNFNLKEIDGLISEKAALTAKVHAATLGMCGLSHLSVSEIAFSKRLATSKKDTHCDQNQQQLQEIYDEAHMLDIHMKWIKKEYLFFDWMDTVLEEHSKSHETELNHMNLSEIVQFISVLHNEMQEQLNFLSSKQILYFQGRKHFECTSRLVRIQANCTEIEKWFTEMNSSYTENDEVLKQKRGEVTEKLKSMLKRIPSCIQI